MNELDQLHQLDERARQIAGLYAAEHERAERLAKACGLIRGYVHFTVANEMAVEGDLENLREWLKVVEEDEKCK